MLTVFLRRSVPSSRIMRHYSYGVGCTEYSGIRLSRKTCIAEDYFNTYNVLKLYLSKP